MILPVGCVSVYVPLMTASCIPVKCISLLEISVADPGFSPGGCANSQNCYYFSNFCRKLHENERIRTGGEHPWRPPWIRQWIFTLLVIQPVCYMPHLCSLNVRPSPVHAPSSVYSAVGRGWYDSTKSGTK